MRVGQTRRRDANEKAIVQALRAYGCDVIPVSGEGAPDLLIRRLGHLWAVEVKSVKGTRTKAQQESQWPIIRSIDDGLRLIGLYGPRTGAAKGGV